MYYSRRIDQYLKDWAERPEHKPLLIRGARQVGKSTAVRHLGEQFRSFVEINLEKQPAYVQLFKPDLDVRRIVPQISALSGKDIREGETLLFIDEIQVSQEAIMSLRFFKEDMPKLHVIAAGSLLEFALDDLPTYGVGRIHSMYMFPMTFDEFLLANGGEMLMNVRDDASAIAPLPMPLHEKLVAHFRDYMIIGGMPEVVSSWVEHHDYLACQEIQDDIVQGYEDDFPKYRKKVSADLLRATLKSIASQVTKKFVYAQVGDGYKTYEVKKALKLLELAGLVIPVTHTAANGIPLGDEADDSYQKMLILDPGIQLRMLNMSLGDISGVRQFILTASETDLVNKGALAEMIAGLEMLHYMTPNIHHELFYWTRQAKSSLAEIDYLSVYGGKVLPVEVKAGTQGGMKSLWLFMREKKLHEAIRCSLENFGEIGYTDVLDDGAQRHVTIYPLYALSRLMKDLAL